jgi:uncharacterized phage protein (TIGR01671 family)
MREFKFRLIFKHPETNHINKIYVTLDELLEGEDLENIRSNLECNCPIDDYESQLKYCDCNWETELISKDIYTRLKDKNENEIYEGDILDNSYISGLSKNKIIKHFEVVYEKGIFWAKLIGKSPFGDEYVYFINMDCEIIGDIHKNPELLEVI